jgi:ribosome-binding protein aMBF1 (putative translation factor)
MARLPDVKNVIKKHHNVPVQNGCDCGVNVLQNAANLVRYEIPNDGWSREKIAQIVHMRRDVLLAPRRAEQKLAIEAFERVEAEKAAQAATKAAIVPKSARPRTGLAKPSA